MTSGHIGKLYADDDNRRVTAKLAFTVKSIDEREEVISVGKGESIPFTRLEPGSPMWIHGSIIGTDFRPDTEVFPPMYSAPSKHAATGERFPSDDVEYLDCSGEWLKLGFGKGTEKEGAGWLAPENQCPNPLTTCP